MKTGVKILKLVGKTTVKVLLWLAEYLEGGK